jgi:hypothetical protein
MSWLFLGKWIISPWWKAQMGARGRKKRLSYPVTLGPHLEATRVCPFHWDASLKGSISSFERKGLGVVFAFFSQNGAESPPFKKKPGICTLY